MKFNLILALFFTLMSFSGYAIDKQIPEKVETEIPPLPDGMEIPPLPDGMEIPPLPDENEYVFGDTTVRIYKPQNDRSKGKVRRPRIVSKEE